MTERPVRVAQPEYHRREQPRLRVGIPVRVQTLYSTGEGQLLDLSATGARIAIEDAPRFGEVVLQWLTIEAFGEIMWSGGGTVGIRFLDPLSAAELVETRHKAPSILRSFDPAVEAARAWVQGC